MEAGVLEFHRVGYRTEGFMTPLGRSYAFYAPGHDNHGSILPHQS